MWVLLLLSAASALNCTLPAKQAQVPATAYYCNNVQVTPEDYQANQGNPNCRSKTTTASICLCPEDAFGQECESLRPLVCSITVISANQSQCTSPKDYNDRLPGLPSCFQVPISAPISLNALLSCYTLNPSVTILSKPSALDLDLTNAVANAQFVYAFNQSGVRFKQLILSRDPEAILNITFINFYYPKNTTYSYGTAASMQQLAGQAPLLLSQPLVDDPLLSVGGRIYFELGLYSRSSRMIMARTYLSAVDIEGYEEPKRKKKVPVGLIVGVIVGVLG